MYKAHYYCYEGRKGIDCTGDRQTRDYTTFDPQGFATAAPIGWRLEKIEHQLASSVK